MPRCPTCALFVIAWLTAAQVAASKEPDGMRFFEQRVRPVLAERCFDCHSGGDAENGLRVDSLAGLLRGGTRGPAMVRGKPKASLLVRAISHGERLQMPPDEKLPARQIADIAAWIKMGAPWPNAKPMTGMKRPKDSPAEFTAEQKGFWAFQPTRAHPLPAVRDQDWVASPMDAFVLARLEARGLKPAPPADKRTLIRRATFDLIGLPPTPDEVEAFVADNSPGVFARLIERLLSSPHYGQRWGRHWLDVARYGDSNGLDENLAFANAFRYRDYVVAAFNKDKPYDQFVQEQLAGDLLPAGTDPHVVADRITATGFLSLGAKMLAEDDPVKMQMDIIDEQVDTVGRAFMGLTLGCARCHDHKFDPLPTQDYYSLAGIFKSTKTMENFKVVARWQEKPLRLPEAVARQQAHRERIAAKEADVRRLKEAKDEKRATAAAKGLEALKKSLPKLPEAMAVSEGQVQDLRVHLRGSHLTLGVQAPRRFPRIIAREEQPAINSGRSGRLELARWLTQPDHPLTARVMVNRIWQGHFGAGLVRSPDNFGRLGQRPTHPRLLDWLAVRFVRSGWSIKSMHRLIMLSSAYRMSAAWNPRAAAVDPENRLCWRMNRRRLEAEAIRDGLLAVSGRLDRTFGGSLLPTPNRKYVTSTANVNPAIYNTSRRSIYLPVVRSALYEVLQAFDFPDPSVLAAKRQTTTVAPQALFMMNSKFVAEQTTAMASALLSDQRLDEAGRMNLAFLRAYGRPPSKQEADRGLQYMRRYTDALASREPSPDKRRLRAWQSLCRVIISANEFVYVE